MADNLSNVIVGADVKFPTHDVSLTDVDGKQAGLILCNRNGIKDPTQLKMSAMPRTPMQMTQGSAGYDDMELPFVAEVQTTMAGGRGNETLSSDRTKFFDSYRLDTTKEYPICAPAVITQTGTGASKTSFVRDYSPNPSGLVDNRYISFKLSVTEATTVMSVNIIINTLAMHILSPGIISYKLSKTDLATGDPTSATGYGYIILMSNQDSELELTLPCDLTYDEAGYLYLLLNFKDASSIPGSTVYYYDNTLSGTVFTTGETSEWTSGTTWGAYAGDGTKTIISAIHSSAESTYKFFEYKRALYAVRTLSSKSSSSLYLNGWRGVADSNGSNPNALFDETQSGWANDAAAGCIVLIINGAGEHEDQPWRRVVNSLSGTLLVDTPWKITHDTTTEYVVLGSDVWTQLTTLDTAPETPVECMDKAVTSVAVVNDYVVFAFGDDDYISCYKVDNNTNVFREQWAITGQKADLLMPIVNEQGDLLLWRADYDDCTVDYATPPAFTATTMTFNFDINAELRADLTLQRDRLYYSLWEELTNSQNDTLLQLTRMKDNLTVEGTRLIGTGTPDSPQAGTLLAEATTRYTNSTADKLAASRAAEDLRLEAYRIIGSGGSDTIAAPGTYVYYSGSPNDVTHDSLLKIANAKGTDAEKIELTNRIYQLIGDGTIAAPGVVELVSGGTSVDSLIKKADTDSDTADALYAIADAEYTELYNRAIDIVGAAATGTVASPTYISGTIQSELQRVIADITAEEARLVRNGGNGSDLMRQILDLTYQITSTATESENSATAEIAGYLAAHTDNTNSVAHKYLPANIKCGSTSSRITNIVPYGTPVIPYIMKEDSFGSISDNIYQEIPLAELKSVRAEGNGKTAMHFGVYLYFNLEGGRIERYFDQRIDDVGFNRDEGMPRERQGEVSKLVPYPGRFYAACDAGFSGYSTVMCNNGMGWHEIYRSGAVGLRITDLYIQAIPGNEYADRLWISETGDMFAVPIAITPLQQYRYNFFGYNTTDFGYVETSWIDFELKDVNKYFHSITIFSDYSSDIKSHQEYDIKVWFKVDDEKSWTYAGNTQAYPNKEIELRYPVSPTAAHNVSGKKIKFKIGMKPNQQYQTPRLKAIVINGVLRMPVKQSWNATFLLEPMSDLRKKTVTNKTLVTPTYPTAAPYDAKLYKRLQDWANSKTHSTPLLMRTNDEISDNHYVFIDPMSIQNVTVQQVMGSGSGEKEYKHIATMTMYEV